MRKEYSLLPAEALLPTIEQMMPDLLQNVQVEGNSLDELVKASRLVQDTYFKTVFDFEAYLPPDVSNFRRIDIRYLPGDDQSETHFQDALQLHLYSETQPHGGNRTSRLIFANWTETDEMTMRQLYVHFVSCGDQYKINHEGDITYVPYSKNIGRMHPHVNPEYFVEKNDFGLHLVHFRYQNFPRANAEGEVVLPSYIVTPNARLSMRIPKPTRKHSFLDDLPDPV